MAARNTQHGDQNAVIFHFFVRQSHSAQHLQAGFLKPTNVIRVVHDAHLVGLVVIRFAFKGEHGAASQVHFDEVCVKSLIVCADFGVGWVRRL